MSEPTRDSFAMYVESAHHAEDDAAFLREMLASYDALAQHAEAAEAERDETVAGAEYRRKLLTALETRCAAAEAERDERDKLWVEALAELAKVDDERIAITRERDALRKDAAGLSDAQLDFGLDASEALNVFSRVWSPEERRRRFRMVIDAALAVQP